jgi:pimeloyl-ACP methyl ester carboxylesterase
MARTQAAGAGDDAASDDAAATGDGGPVGDVAAADRRAAWLAWKTVDVEGRSTAYGEAGAGRTVLFLHGWGLDHRAYKRALSRLVAAGARVLAPALPGFGGTAPMPGSRYTIEGFAEWLTAFLDAVGVDEPVVAMGHSFGGGVAIRFAHDHPARVRALVLVNSIGASAWTTRDGALRSMAQRPLWDWGIHFPADLWPLRQARRVLPVIVGEALPNLARDPVSFLRVAVLARHADLTGELDELKRRRLPVVVLWGNRDRLVTRASFEEMCRVLGGPHAVTVAGTHAWLIADPDAFGEIMTNVVGIGAGVHELERLPARRVDAPARTDVAGAGRRRAGTPRGPRTPRSA